MSLSQLFVVLDRWYDAPSLCSASGQAMSVGMFSFIQLHISSLDTAEGKNLRQRNKHAFLKRTAPRSEQCAAWLTKKLDSCEVPFSACQGARGQSAAGGPANCSLGSDELLAAAARLAAAADAGV